MMQPPRRLTCDETFARLDDYLDRELTPEEIREVEAHLAECVVCAEEYRFETTLLAGLRQRLRRVAVPADLLTNVLARLDAAGRRG